MTGNMDADLLRMEVSPHEGVEPVPAWLRSKKGPVWYKDEVG